MHSVHRRLVNRMGCGNVNQYRPLNLGNRYWWDILRSYGSQHSLDHQLNRLGTRTQSYLDNFYKRLYYGMAVHCIRQYLHICHWWERSLVDMYRWLHDVQRYMCPGRSRQFHMDLVNRRNKRLDFFPQQAAYSENQFTTEKLAKKSWEIEIFGQISTKFGKTSMFRPPSKQFSWAIVANKMMINANKFMAYSW